MRDGGTTPAVSFALAAVSAIAASVVYATGGQPQLEGVCLAGAFGGIGIGLVTWAKRLLPADTAVEERDEIRSSPADVDAVVRALGEGDPLARRRFLASALGAALSALVVALAFPVRSLGPRPGRGLRSTPWRVGSLRLVTEDGSPVADGQIAPGGALTVFPEGFVGVEDAQAILLRLAPGSRFRPRAGREDWSVGDQVAFSKICTHAGCPVGLFEKQRNVLLCPCHQSTFDVSDACRPVFGPATRSLPQLPLGVDDAGYLVARGDFSDPVGPGFWDRGR